MKQGSILSPTIFIIVIDSLLRSLNATHQGLSRLGLDVGSSAHADDIRVVSNSADAVSRLGSCVNSFCSANSLKLNASKTEAVSFSKGCPLDTTLQVASDTIHSQLQIKCLGVWWQHDLSPSKSVEENISKARRAFFATGSLGSFHGKLNPLSGRMMARVLFRKLNFLAKLLTSYEDTQSARTFRTLAAENIYNISLIQQCLWLLRTLNSEQILHNCLENPDSATSVIKSARNTILQRDWANTIQLAKSYMSLN